MFQYCSRTIHIRVWGNQYQFFTLYFCSWYQSKSLYMYYNIIRHSKVKHKANQENTFLSIMSLTLFLGSWDFSFLANQKTEEKKTIHVKNIMEEWLFQLLILHFLCVSLLFVFSHLFNVYLCYLFVFSHLFYVYLYLFF